MDISVLLSLDNACSSTACTMLFPQFTFSHSMPSSLSPPLWPKIICLLIAFITSELYFCPQRSLSGGPQDLIHASLFILIMQFRLGDFFSSDDL